MIPHPPNNPTAQLSHFVHCYLNIMTTAPWNGTVLPPVNINRFGFEALLGHCVLTLPNTLSLPVLGVLANIANDPDFVVY